jgi:hypothetical protein
MKTGKLIVLCKGGLMGDTAWMGRFGEDSMVTPSTNMMVF